MESGQRHFPIYGKLWYTFAMERMDDLQHNGLVLFQDTAYACFNADALLLLGFLRLAKRDNAIELGSGTGVICVLGADNTGASFTGVEIQPRLVALSQKSAEANRQEIRFLCADVQDAPKLLGRGVFTAAIMNPPYFANGDKNGNASYAISRHEADSALTIFLSAAFQLLNNGGKLFMIYPADALNDLFAALREHRLEPKRIRFVYSKPESKAIRVLVEAKKLGKAGLIVEPPARTQANDTDE